MDIDNFPHETLQHILSFVDCDFLTKHTCKKWYRLLRSKPNTKHDPCSYAAKNGYLDVLRWAKENGYPWSKYRFISAISGGHIEILEWILDNDPKQEAEYAMKDAAIYGHIEMLKWLKERGFIPHDVIWSAAAHNGKIEVLEWLIAEGYELDPNGLCEEAAQGGHLSTLIWAREHGCPWDSKVREAAADYDHMDVLKWAIENGCPVPHDGACDKCGTTDENVLEFEFACGTRRCYDCYIGRIGGLPLDIYDRSEQMICEPAGDDAYDYIIISAKFTGESNGIKTFSCDIGVERWESSDVWGFDIAVSGDLWWVYQDDNQPVSSIGPKYGYIFEPIDAAKVIDLFMYPIKDPYEQMSALL